MSLVTLPSPSQYPAYVRAISALPVLSAEEENRLAWRWVKQKCSQSAKELVLSNLRLVIKAVRDHEGYGLSKEDLAQEGTVGLMKAVQKFDPSKGVRLSTYAWYWIDAEIKEFVLKNWRLVGWGTSSLAKKMFFGYRKTVQSLRSWGENRLPPTAQEIAASMEISLSDAHMLSGYFNGSDMALFLEDGSDREDVMGEMLEASVDASVQSSLPSWSDSPLLLLEHEDDLSQHQAVVKALEHLPARTQNVIRDRFLLEKPKTLSTLSQEHGVSLERIRQLEKEGLALLKKMLNTPPSQPSSPESEMDLL